MVLRQRDDVALGKVYITVGQDDTCDYIGTTHECIQEAINKANSLGGGTVLIKGGTWNLTAALTISNSSYKLKIKGSGKGITILKQLTASTNIITIGTNCSVDIEDISLELPSAGNTGHGIIAGASGSEGLRRCNWKNVDIRYCDATHYGVYLYNCVFCSFESVSIRTVVNGLMMENDHATLNYGNCLFSDLVIDGTAALVNGINIASTDKIMNFNTFIRTHVVASTGYTGTAITVNGDSNHFYGMNLENLDYGILVTGGKGNVFTAGYVSANGSTGGCLAVTNTACRHNIFRDIDIIEKDTAVLGLQDVVTTINGYTLFDSIRVGNFTTAATVTAQTRLRNIKLAFSGKLSDKKGTSTQSGNAVLTTFNIAHGLYTTPLSYSVQAASLAASALHYVTADATNLIIEYAAAPANAANNLTWVWDASVTH